MKKHRYDKERTKGLEDSTELRLSLNQSMCYEATTTVARTVPVPSYRFSLNPLSQTTSTPPPM
uniref:Uncharacterized protein n=1 Tax=Pristionchus pacificus TaxID=54126 RepID=A0A2A6CQX7_PRIPA|eukprot:PDM80539.1 hypothetical protein PRIPAC_35542 [Pristionchus pacificus]